MSRRGAIAAGAGALAAAAIAIALRAPAPMPAAQLCAELQLHVCDRVRTAGCEQAVARNGSTYQTCLADLVTRHADGARVTCDDFENCSPHAPKKKMKAKTMPPAQEACENACVYLRGAFICESVDVGRCTSWCARQRGDEGMARLRGAAGCDSLPREMLATDAGARP